MHRSTKPVESRFSVLRESGGRPWTCIIGREGATRLRYHKGTGERFARVRMVPLRINDAFRGRSIEGPDSAQRNDIAVIIRDPSHPPIALIPRQRNRNTHSSFLLTHTRFLTFLPCLKYRSFRASYFACPNNIK